jgi:hypothetical protein
MGAVLVNFRQSEAQASAIIKYISTPGIENSEK